MLKIAIVVFRECLEVALLLGMIMAVTKPIVNSRTYIILGTLIGVVLASVFAFFTQKLKRSFGGEGDDLFDSCIILLTAAIISWTVVWMQGYSRKIKKDLSKLSESINAGVTSQLTLVLVVATAILREGAEIILFIFGLSTAHAIEGTQYLLGIGVGVFSGLTVGVIFYLGLLKFAGKYVFKICTVLLILIAAGLSAEAAGILTSSGFIEVFSEGLWDSNWLINNKSSLGRILNVTFGYDATPNGMQLMFYIATILLTMILMKLRSTFSRNNYV